MSAKSRHGSASPAFVYQPLEPADAPFDVLEPERRTVPFVFASPHSGRTYSEAFRAASRLDPVTLRRSEDAFIDELFAAAPLFGAPLLRAHFPRAYVDPNREPFELDPAMFEGRLPAHCNTTSPRVAAGLGTVARVVTSGEEIYRHKLGYDDAIERIERFYRPYHAALAGLIADTRRQFGHCVLLDCHSMPSVGGPMDQDSGVRRVDVVLGDAHGTSCAASVVDTAERLLKSLDFVVARNIPYAGGHTTRHYGKPGSGVHALQIEINRALYMDERTVARGPGLPALAAKLARFVELMVRMDPKPLAAETSSKPRSVAAGSVVVRPAAADDMGAIQAIYAHHVRHGLASFECDPPDLAEMTARWQNVVARGLPFRVLEADGKIAGFAYAAPYRARVAYRFSVEDSVYVVPEAAGRGYGRMLLADIITACATAGMRQMVAVIGDSANAASIGLHQQLGFRQVGTLVAAGFKLGRWVDSVLMQRSLGEADTTPPKG
ncbi:MAG: GNAT family N-acetyltransferase [Rhodospirillales bacterium]|nr:GNAT family N-acetyltransferase [Rhodospirillales bacterium]